jgi:DNA-binding MarR family transcriptional regulator
MIVHVVRSIPVPDGASAAPSSPQVREILDDLRVAFGELRCVGSERMVKQGVSMTNLHVMSMLDHHGTLTMSRLAELLDISLSNATGLIDRLEERGFVERERDRDDRRVVTVRLAEGGREKLHDIQLIKDELLETILARLDPDALSCVQSALISVRQAALDVAADPAVAQHWHAHSSSHHHSPPDTGRR